MIIEDALCVLLASKKRELKVREAVELIELISKDPEFIKNVLAYAEKEGMIKREATSIIISSGKSAFPLPKIRKTICESNCRRCNMRIKNCHYIILDNRELGPYGSSCVQKLL